MRLFPFAKFAAKWLLLAPLAFLVATYLLFLLLNLNDRPASEAARHFEQEYARISDIPSSESAWLFAFGFDAPRGQGPMAVGRERAAWMREKMATPFPRIFEGMPFDGENENSPGDERTEAQRLVADALGDKESPTPFTTVEMSELLHWLERDAWKLARYEKLIGLGEWQEMVFADPAAPFIQYSKIMDGQELLLVNARLKAEAGEIAALRALLQKDMEFWRMVMRESNLLISKMIAAAAIERSFRVGNAILKELPDGGAEAVPESWQQPFTSAEVSLARAMIGEWAFGKGIVDMLAECGDDCYAELEMNTSYSFVDKATESLFMSLFQPQHSTNLISQNFLSWSNKTTVSPADLPEQLADIEMMEPFDTDGFWYNPVGRLLVQSAAPEWGKYAARSADLEGVRRATLLAVTLRQLRANDASSEHFDQMRSAVEFSDPYTGQPLELDSQGPALQFRGLEEGDRGAHRIFL